MMNTRFEITEVEADRRIDELLPIARLGHLYSRVRRGIVMDDGTFETDGDHVVQLQLMSLAYVSKYHPELDPGRLMILLLVHDLREAIVGDTPTLGLNEQQLAEKDRLEASAMQELMDICKDFPVLIDYLEAYESFSSPEANFGKAFDKLTPGYSHFHDRGATLRRLYDVHSHEDLVAATEASDARLEQYAAGFQDIIAMRKALHRKVGHAAFGAGMLQSEQ